jgi:Uma2 family endonuclease
MSSVPSAARTRRVSYPESDGKPMGETDLHRDLMTDLIFALKWFLGNLRAYVAGNLFLYFEEGNPKAVVAPDVFVVMGVQQRRRRIYCSWKEEGRLPDVVIELTSKKTRQADQTTKPALYARLGISEYFLFDPFGEYLQQRLQGYRLVDGAYEPMREYPLRSAVLGLELREEDNTLRLYNPKTGLRLPTSDEEVLARRAAEAARNEAELRLTAETEALRIAEATRIETELRLNAEAEARRAAEARAAAAEAELARLRAERGDQ